MIEQRTFNGFFPKTFPFLKENKARNSKEWFEKNRHIYNENVLYPLQSLVLGLTPIVLSIDNEIETAPQVNKTISRVYRDTRFSRDKSIFRDDIWISFKRPGNPGFTRPEFYFYATSEHYESGMGYYSADRKAMDLFKKGILADKKSFGKAIEFMQSPLNPFTLITQIYKKPQPVETDDDYQEWLMVKTFHFSNKREIDNRFFSAKLVEEIIEAYSTLGPLYRFIVCSTIDYFSGSLQNSSKS